MQFKWFLLIGVFGTMVYVTVMQRIQEQDHSKNLEKYKKTFTEEEWSKYINEIQKKHLTLESDEECFLLPFTYNNSNSSQVKLAIEKLGGESNVGVLDLNKLVESQLTDDQTSKAKYHILLSQSLEAELKDAPGFRYTFTYKLKSGIFTQIVNDEIQKLKAQNPSLGRFVILNYPPNIKEAIKFEQNVCNKDTLLTVDDKLNETEIVQYFETVDKVKSVANLPKLEPLIVDTSNLLVKKALEPEEEPVSKLHTLSATEPAADAPAIEKAQYKLRQLGQPIREYGESDVDVINRLKELQK